MLDLSVQGGLCGVGTCNSMLVAGLFARYVTVLIPIADNRRWIKSEWRSMIMEESQRSPDDLSNPRCYTAEAENRASVYQPIEPDASA